MSKERQDGREAVPRAVVPVKEFCLTCGCKSVLYKDVQCRRCWNDSKQLALPLTSSLQPASRPLQTARENFKAALEQAQRGDV